MLIYLLIQVGQSIRFDIAMLNKDFKGLINSNKGNAYISNYVEISELAKFLIPGKKSYSLANIAEMVLGILIMLKYLKNLFYKGSHFQKENNVLTGGKGP